jgi:hypothetical protein
MPVLTWSFRFLSKDQQTREDKKYRIKTKTLSKAGLYMHTILSMQKESSRFSTKFFPNVAATKENTRE